MIDLPLSAWFHAHSNPALTQFMLLISDSHGITGVLLMSAVLGLALLHLRRPWWLLALVLSVPGGMLLNVAVKNVVQRARPRFDDPMLVLTTYSFPSGHTAATTLFYGFLTALVFAHEGARRWRRPMLATAVAMVLLVGLSRIYLGAHYFTDVFGAIALALCWLGASLAGVQALSRRRGGRGAIHG